MRDGGSGQQAPNGAALEPSVVVVDGGCNAELDCTEVGVPIGL